MILLIILLWLFVGLLTTGIIRRTNGKQRRADVLMFVVLAPIFMFIAMSRVFENSDWWDKKI